ncbi:MAG: tripartite tricarboxylate transporter substrate binding protein [Betaproteobacteria bacterium]|nr:tripartite tricarboxylate transporter substrate binding protein [Betaproteobacteria bacterium]
MPLRRLLYALIFAAAANAALAQTYPNRPIRLVVPAPPGGTIDPISRILGEGLNKLYGQNVIIDNRPGANFNVGMDIVAKSQPDGYTLVVASSGALATNIHLYRSLPFHPVNSFEHIVLYGNVPNVLVVHPSLPVKTLAEFTAHVKANPGKFNFGSTGNGSSMHLAGELYKSMSGTQMTHVPYVSPAAATQDLLAGRTQLMFQLMTGIAQFVRADKVRGIAVLSPKRSSALPDLPTTAEAGMKGLESSAWFGILAPKDTPRDIVEKLNRDINTLIAEPAFNKRLIEFGVEPMGGSVRDFQRYLEAEIKKWGDVVRASGAKLD